MFTIIVKNETKGFFKRLFTKGYILNMVQTPKFSFNIISVKKPLVKRSKILSLLHNNKCEFIIQNGITLDSYTDITYPKSEVLTQNLMYDMLASTLKSAEDKNKLAKKKVVLYDIDCENTKYLSLLANYFSDITIITENRKKYNKIASKTLANAGIALTVSNYLNNVKEADLIVSPKGDNVLKNKTISAIYYGAPNTMLCSKHMYTNFTALPIKAICRHVPPKVSLYEFLCAIVNEYGYDEKYLEQKKLEYSGKEISDFTNHLLVNLANN